MMTTTTSELGKVRPCEEAILAGFARADLPFDEEWLAVFLSQRRKRLTSLFWKCFASTFEARVEKPSGLEAIMLEDNLDVDLAWPTAIGQVRRVMLLDRSDPDRAHRALRAAVGVALHHVERGRPASFRVTLDAPETFLFGGHALRAAKQIICESDGTYTELRLDGESWTATRSSALPRITTPRRDVPVLPALPFAESLPEPLVAGEANDATAAHFADAFAILASANPIFVPWVARPLRALIPVLTPPDKTISSSFEDLPGVIALSHHSDAILLADCLVHEASHQHVFFLQQLGPIDDGSDDTLYWSPARREDRPLEKIVLAYHAFVNILRFWEACRDRGIGDEAQCLRMIAHKRHYVDELRKPLDTVRARNALTKIGQALIT